MNLGIKIKKIISVDEESLKLKFSDGFSGVVDLSHFFSKPKNLAAEIMKGGLISKCYIESGALAWSNGFELFPDSLRMKLKDLKRSKVS